MAMASSTACQTGEQRSLTPDEIPSTPSAASSTPARDRYLDLAGLDADDRGDGAHESEVEPETEDDFERGLFFMSPGRSALRNVEMGDNAQPGKRTTASKGLHANETVGSGGLEIELSFDSAWSQAGDPPEDDLDDHDQLLSALGLQSSR